MTKSNIPDLKSLKYPEGFLVDNFEGLRKKLLDITGARSKLLDLKQDQKSSVRIVDQRPDQLSASLLQGQQFTMISIPEPREKELVEHGYIEWDEVSKSYLSLKPHPKALEWARLLGINTHHELAVEAGQCHDDCQKEAHIQVGLYDAALSNKMKHLEQISQASIEETGNNILFLSLGFLEWADHKDGRVRLAPLYMIPITIDKCIVRQVIRYRIQYTGEDIIFNLTLGEKLSQDFGIILPDIVDEKDEDRLLTPEEYFLEVAALLALKSDDQNIRHWKIRRFGTLATVSLGGLLMYRDLDPRRWPNGRRNIVHHPFINLFFSNRATGHENQIDSGFQSYDNQEPRDQDYVLDDVPEIHEHYPMVEDADSSQMSALIDVLSGKSIVIEGPPGTGKSQTITNIIAAAISQGKSVLFVAEKQAALDVVFQRINAIDLGHFCLDLHSNKAQKKRVLESFNQRILLKKRHEFSEKEYCRKVNFYERAREELHSYCQVVNQKWKETGFTVHEILNAATRYKTEVEWVEYHQVYSDNFNPDDFNHQYLDERIECIERFWDYMNAVSQQLAHPASWESHPWFGVCNKEMTPLDEVQLKRKIEDWSKSLDIYQETLQNLSNDFTLSISDTVSYADSLQWNQQLQQLKPLTGKEYLPSFSKITPEIVDSLNDALADTKEISVLFYSLNTFFNQSLLSDVSLYDQFFLAINGLRERGIADAVGLQTVVRVLDDFKGMIVNVSNLESQYSSMIQGLPPALKSDVESFLVFDFDGLHTLKTLLYYFNQLPVELLSFRDELFDSESFSSVLADFTEEQSKLIREREHLASIFNIEKLPSFEALHSYALMMDSAGMFSILSSAWRQSKKEIVVFYRSNTIEIGKIEYELAQAALWKKATQNLKNNKRYAECFGRYFNGIDTNTTALAQLHAWYTAIRKEYGYGFGEKTALAKLLLTSDNDFFRSAQSLKQSGCVELIDSILAVREKLLSLFPHDPCLTQCDASLLRQDEFLLNAYCQFTEVIAFIQPCLKNADACIGDMKSPLDQLEQLGVKISNLKHAQIDHTLFDDTIVVMPSSEGQLSEGVDIFEASLQFIETVFKTIQQPELIDYIQKNMCVESFGALQKRAIVLNTAAENVSHNESEVMDMMQSNTALWLKGTQDTIGHLIERNTFALQKSEWLDGWKKYLYACDRMGGFGLSRLQQYLIEFRPSAQQSTILFRFAVFTTLANTLYEQVPVLSQRSGHEQTAIQQQFRDYDKALKILQRQRVASRALNRIIQPGTKGVRVSDYRGDYLLKHEIGKKARHIAIRKLVEKAGDTMLCYKPCWMMSPTAVAKYLPPGQLEFDIVIMDEASQVKPQFAMSCFARGKQAVIVGDPKQLPPTSFFDRITCNDDDDKAVIDDAESILEAVSGALPTRLLKWHYRSRHESLIEFSNKMFYDSELIIFPSPWSQSSEFGIKFHFIEDGVYESSLNEVEAQRVANAVREHVLYNAHESIGVVAMNLKQSHLVSEHLERMRRQDPVFDEALQVNSNQNEPLFIKNLESVQGDERDVILISFTYGPVIAGAHHMPQRFFPINNEEGWRRLNVLFTRSKKRMHVYSSMKSNYILIGEKQKRGVVALKAFLEFAQTGVLTEKDAVSVGAPDSDFEIAVIQRLSRAGFECVPQVGVAGFRIDIGVKDPRRPGQYLMGIECDGATYHSSKSTRDRDQVRQSVLEGLQWHIRRIWSTDWFKNPEAELKPILDELIRRAAPPVNQIVSTKALEI